METLLQRVSEGLMPEFRREAVGQLRDLLAEGNPRTQVALGNASGLTVCEGRAHGSEGGSKELLAGHPDARMVHECSSCRRLPYTKPSPSPGPGCGATRSS